MWLGYFQIRLAETTTRFLEDHKVLSFSIFSLFYFGGACGKASSKAFWYDELFSWYVAQLPSLSAILNAINEGAENHPPLHYFLIHTSHWIFGTGELATRFPFIIGYWLALFFLFLFITKRCGSLIAYISILFLCLSASYPYAFEARPYALVLACCGASLFCWQLVIEGRYRRVALLGLSLSLGMALCSHYYAIFLFVPLIIGEGYRSIRSKKVDWPIWISMAAGAIVLIPLVPMMLKVGRYSESFWAKPTRGTFQNSIDWFFRDPVLVWYFGIGCLIGVLKDGYSLTSNKRTPLAGRNVPCHDWVAAMTLMLFPVIGFVFAKFVTQAFTPRYFLPTAIGIALGLAFLYQRLLQDRLFITAILLGSLLSVFICQQTVDARGLGSKKPKLSKVQSITQALDIPGDTPVVISTGTEFLQYMKYAPESLKSRLCYLIDPNTDGLLSSDTVDRSMGELKKRFPMCVEDYRSFLSSHHHFYVYGPINLLLFHLLEDGVQIKVKSKGREILLEVFVDDSLSGKASR
jgi:hypothetical protein